MASLIEPQSSDPQSSDPSQWKPKSALLGNVLANRYRITSLVGQGSTGAVFRADDQLLGKPVAVRILVPALAQRAQLPRIHARIDRHQEITRQRPAALVNLVDITDAGMTLDGEIFVVTDFIDGDDLSDMLLRGGRLPWSRGGSLFIRLGQIIQDFHDEGIILGTLQARHCYAVRGKSKQETIKIVNHALFEHFTADIGPNAGPEVVRQIRYLAPEVACGEPVDPRTDVYSFGVIAYELLTGSAPFVDANPMRLVAMHLQRTPRAPSELAPDLPPEIDAAVLRCLAKAPADRFQSIAEVVEALEAVPLTATARPAVSASAAATEIPPPPAALASPMPGHAALELSPSPAASPMPAAAALDPTASTTPAASPDHAAALDPTASPTHAPSPGAAAATLAVTNATSPPAADTRPGELSAPAAVEASPSRPESAPVPRLGSPTSSRPSTIPPGGLRLPPPPTLGRPSTIPPSGLPFGLPPLGAPPKLPATGMSRGETSAVSSVPPAAVLQDSLTPAAPSSAAPAPAATDPLAAAAAAAAQDSSLAAAAAVPQDSSLAAAATVPQDISLAAAAAPQDGTLAAAATVPADSSPPAASVPADSLDAPSASALPRVPARSGPTPQVHATLIPGSAQALSIEHALPGTSPAPARDELRAASTSGARRIIRLTEIRGKTGDDSASSSGAFLKVALTDATDSAQPGPQAGAAEPGKAEGQEPAAQPAAQPEPKPQPQAADSKPRLAVSGEALRAAALHQSPASQASLSQVTGTSDSIIAQLPRRNNTLLIGGAIALIAAAGVAFFMITRPGPEQRIDVAVNAPIARKLPAPAPDVDPGKPTLPDARVDPTAPPNGDTLPVKPATDPTGAPPTIVAMAEPEPEPEPEPDPEPKTGKKPGKKPRKAKEVEPEEPDIFDQVRAHMNQQKAEEEARKAALASSQAAKSEPVTDSDKAREIFGRAKEASGAGNLQLCFSLARQSNTLVKSNDALELMGTCACRLKNETSARVAYNALSGERKDRVASTCSASGITL